MRRSKAPSNFKSKSSGAGFACSTFNENLGSDPVPPVGAVRSVSKILSLLSNDDDFEPENFSDSRQEFAKQPEVDKHGMETDNTPAPASEKIIFEAYYRKMTAKKHKTWEGDGTVVVEGRSAILKDENGKEMGRISKVKNDVVFEEGTQLLIGGKEVGLGSKLHSEKVVHPSPSPPSKQPQAKKSRLMTRPRDAVGEDDFVLPKPSPSHQWEFNKNGQIVNDMVVDRFLARALRPHQKEGIVFLYESVMGMRGPTPGQYWGCLLADEMGLGKTLQCIALMWTLFKQKPYGRSGGELRRVLIVTPRTLVENWERDIFTWLGYSRLKIFKVDSKNRLSDYSKRLSHVAIVSYESYARQVDDALKFDWDLLICDEAHCLKNPDTEKAKAVKKLKCQRRILLTGSPCQNNLTEFFEILNIANPGCLGTKEEFLNEFARPIVRADEPDCSDEERFLGKEKTEHLHSLINRFMLRRTAELLVPYLPSKQDVIIMCIPAELQKKMYHAAISYWTDIAGAPECIGCHSGVPTLKAITSLRQICNHPSLLKPSSFTDGSDEAMDEDLQSHLSSLMGNQCDIHMEEHSGKLKVVCSILEYLSEVNVNKNRDRVLIISYFTQTLNMLESLCKRKGYNYCRLDGTTPQNKRIPMVNEFNDKRSQKFVFLLSAKAGGTGLNLTGASRLILFDLDWNPANDAQALGRVWRGSQSRPVIIYRLLTAGTIEEKIFQRQIKKSTLNKAISKNKGSIKLSSEELKDLFSYDDTLCQTNLTHEMLRCDCSCDGNNLREAADDKGSFCDDDEHECSIPGIDDLVKWKHLGQPIDPVVLQDVELLYGQESISFMFHNHVSKNN